MSGCHRLLAPLFILRHYLEMQPKQICNCKDELTSEVTYFYQHLVKIFECNKLHC